MKKDIRRLALGLLDEMEAADKYANLALEAHYLDGLSRDERASLTALLYTTVEHRLTYDYVIGAISKREIAKLDRHTANILRLGLCQLMHMDSVPDFAAVNESVNLARNSGERSFVNGVLRSAARMGDKVPMPDPDKNYSRYLSVKYSFPQHTVKRFISLFGEADTESLLDRFNSVSYTDLTVNTTRTDPETFMEILRSEGYEPTLNLDTGISIRLERSVNPENLPGFSDGLFFVQDRASLVSVMALSPTEEHLVVDCCACPGGKSFAASVLMGGKGKVHSFDLHESKLSLIFSGSDRLGLNNITVDQRDARDPAPELVGQVDKVICDAPCSGIGVLGKKPDLRYKSDESITALPELQYSILEASAKYLRRGGELVYSTCTLSHDENEKVVSDFLSGNGDYEAMEFSVGSLHSEGGMLTMIPHIHKTDGFFIAKIRRK